MAVDLTGGFGDEREYLFAKRPDDPNMRESVNAWIWDRGSDVCIPRIGIEAVGETWDNHLVQVNVACADGRVFTHFFPGTSHSPFGADGKPRILGSGPLSFELVEPFRHWKMHFDGKALATTVKDQIASNRPTGEPDVPVSIELDIVAAAPPWENGALLASARKVLEEQDEGAMMAGPRFEQLSRATGKLRIADTEHRIDGGALRIRRQGIRRLATFRGHAWQSALFPSGRGFGYIVYPERDDGLPTYNEGYLFEGDGKLIPAWVVEAPWLARMQPTGEDVSVVLETEKGGTTTIKGTSIISTFAVIPGMGIGVPVLQQALARYTWEGESANGMMERSMPSAKVAIG